MVERVVSEKGGHMDPTDVKLLQAIHEVKEDVGVLKSKLDDSVNGRFKDLERRVFNLEGNLSKLVWAVLAANIAAIMSIILK